MTRYSPRTGLPQEYQVGPFSRQHALLQWGGSLPGGEEWSCSLRLAPNTFVNNLDLVPPNSNLQSWLHGSMKDAVVAFHTRAASHISAACNLQYVKLNKIGLDGHYAEGSTNEHVLADTGGGGSPPYPPNQLALAISLTTNVSRGPAHRGRFFMPMPSMVLDPFSGVITASDADAVRGSAKTFLEAIADVPGLDFPGTLTPVVMSRKAGNPTYRVVEGVDVGRVLDTQRRRRRSLPESYEHVQLDL
jgi:hypothetical protein